jgi:hypothetical protein
LRPTRSGNHHGQFLGDQAKSKRLRGIILFVIAEADRLERSISLAFSIGWMSCLYRRDIPTAESLPALDDADETDNCFLPFDTAIFGVTRFLGSQRLLKSRHSLLMSATAA